MRLLYTVFIAFICFSSHAQLKIDSIFGGASNSMMNYYPSKDPITDKLYVGHTDATGSEQVILVYDKDLKLLDTLNGNDVGRTGISFIYPFVFNNSLYYVCRDSYPSSLRKFSIHKLENGVFTDSIALDLDTIAGGYPSLTTEVNNNTLQMLINIDQPNGQTINSRILYLDSNFQFKSYYRPNLDSITGVRKQITAIHHLNDSIWHLYLDNRVAIYKPQSNTLDIKQYQRFLFQGFKTYSLKNETYAVFGVTSEPVKSPSLGSNIPGSLGFYIIDKDANILDTISFNAFRDTVHSLNYVNYSFENIGNDTKNIILYDTNTIYLASRGSYSEYNSIEPKVSYFHVVKSNISGNLKWQFTWGRKGDVAIFTGIAPTSDKGCIVTGGIRRGNTFDFYAMVIKLGPDGKISNVEVDAPENLVAFYPNPIKDKLHFDYLPEANGQYTLEVMDMNGKPVLETSLNEEKGFIPMQLKTGFYIYQLKDETGKVMQVGKLVAE